MGVMPDPVARRRIQVPKKARNNRPGEDSLRLISLKSIAKLVDAHRASVRRWLNDERIRPVAVGRGRNSAIRYRWSDIERWLSHLEEVD
jgi:predicted DNA-binding transcriptional regulator AlpA